jgi:hypothetical protein
MNCAIVTVKVKGTTTPLKHNYLVNVVGSIPRSPLIEGIKGARYCYRTYYYGVHFPRPYQWDGHKLTKGLITNRWRLCSCLNSAS